MRIVERESDIELSGDEGQEARQRSRKVKAQRRKYQLLRSLSREKVTTAAVHYG